MLFEPEPDPLVLELERQQFDKHPGWQQKLNAQCRHSGLHGPQGCSNPVVRSGRCIAHAPKLTVREKSRLSPEQLAAEQAFEADFVEHMSGLAKIRPSGNYEWDGVHFCSIEWNQPPWLDLLKRGSFYCGMMVFHQPANFSLITLAHRPLFDRTVFRDSATFTGARFSHGGIFKNAHFKGNAHFGSTFEGDLLFSDCTFYDDVQFSNCTINGTLSFSNCIFYKKVSFDNSEITGTLLFSSNGQSDTFCSDFSFRRVRLGPNSEVRFEMVPLRSATFLWTSLERIMFWSVSWEIKRTFGLTRISRRRVLADELAIKRGKLGPELLEPLADNYRQLVLASEKRRDFDASEDFHIGEMEVRRLLEGSSYRNRFFRTLRNTFNAISIYRVLSCYGSSYWQAISVFIGFFILFSTALLFFGLNVTAEGKEMGLTPIEYSVDTSVLNEARAKQLLHDWLTASHHCLLVATFQRERLYSPSGIGGYLFQLLASLVLPGQAALMLLAIRRRFKR